LEEQARNAVAKNTVSIMDPVEREMLERDAHSFWDKFYNIHQNK
jgi:hypothetical protein